MIHIEHRNVIHLYLSLVHCRRRNRKYVHQGLQFGVSSQASDLLSGLPLQSIKDFPGVLE
jgi:hypothetical protein